MKKAKPEVSKILGPVLREIIALLFDPDRLTGKSWLREACERSQGPKYTYPLKRDSKGRIMKPEMVNS